MILRYSSFFTRRLTEALTVSLALSVVVLGWFGVRAVREWQRSATLVAEQRAQEAADLLVRALTRDMRGVQTLVLSSPNVNDAMLDSPRGVRELVASAFARYPYPEAFFSWTGPADGSVTFLVRADRRPAWIQADETALTTFPVVVGSAFSVGRNLVARVTRDAMRGARFSTFDFRIGTTTYQVVARVVSRSEPDEGPQTVFGFLVDLEWSRRNYFSGLVTQIAQIASEDSRLLLTVSDDTGNAVATTGTSSEDGPTARRSFSMLFFDPSLVIVDPPPDLAQRVWTAQAAATEDLGMLAASRATRLTLSLSVVSAIVLALGLALTAHAVSASTRLSEMRADFVSIATHELKTPLATIRAVGQTLALGKISDRDMLREYAELVVQESKRLTRLVDNLLSYARITDPADVYSFAPMGLPKIVETTLHEFAPQLKHSAFEVHLDLPADLPLIRADRVAMGLMFDNLVDNAIRYSADRRWLGISARASDAFVSIDVQDHGNGIPHDEVKHVTRKFFRGQRAGSRGSGLGLAIARRIARDHGGSLAISSQVDRGTTVTVTLPIVRADNDETNPDC